MAEAYQSKQNEKKFELLTYLELTCSKLEECFEDLTNNRYDEKIKANINKELSDFYNLMFKDKKLSNKITNSGKYISMLIGKELGAKDPKERLNKGFAYLWENLDYLSKNPDYSKLKGKNSEQLKNFFSHLSDRFESHSKKILKSL